MKAGEIYLHKDVEMGYDYVLELKNVRNATNEADVKVIDLICGDVRNDIVKITRIENHGDCYKVDAQKLFEVMNGLNVEIRALNDMLADRDATIANIDAKKSESAVVVCLKNGKTATVEGGVRWENVYDEARIRDSDDKIIGVFVREKISGIFLKRLDKLSRQ